MTVIYLVRHGQASFSADNYDQLSDQGIEQAKLVGQYLQKKISMPNRIITGDMLRHQQTAANSLDAFLSEETDAKINPQEDARWNEYDHQNILGAYNPELSTPSSARQYLAQQAKPLEHFKTLFINAVEQWIAADNQQAYSESFTCFSRRVITALKDVAEQNKTGNVIIYTSGGPISLVVCYLLGMPLSQFIEVNWSLVNAGVTKIVTRGNARKLTLSTLNEHDIFEQHTNKKLITYT